MVPATEKILHMNDNTISISLPVSEEQYKVTWTCCQCGYKNPVVTGHCWRCDHENCVECYHLGSRAIESSIPELHNSISTSFSAISKGHREQGWSRCNSYGKNTFFNRQFSDRGHTVCTGFCSNYPAVDSLVMKPSSTELHNSISISLPISKGQHKLTWTCCQCDHKNPLVAWQCWLCGHRMCMDCLLKHESATELSILELHNFISIFLPISKEQYKLTWTCCECWQRNPHHNWQCFLCRHLMCINCSLQDDSISTSFSVISKGDQESGWCCCNCYGKNTFLNRQCSDCGHTVCADCCTNCPGADSLVMKPSFAELQISTFISTSSFSQVPNGIPCWECCKCRTHNGWWLTTCWNCQHVVCNACPYHPY